jgi:hypothetical protein
VPTDGKPIEVNPMDLISSIGGVRGMTCGYAAENEASIRFSVQHGVKSMVTVRAAASHAVCQATDHVAYRSTRSTRRRRPTTTSWAASRASATSSCSSRRFAAGPFSLRT